MTKKQKLTLLHRLRSRFMELNSRHDAILQYGLCACLDDVLKRSGSTISPTLESIGLERPMDKAVFSFWYTRFGYSAYDLRVKAIDNVIDKLNNV